MKVLLMLNTERHSNISDICRSDDFVVDDDDEEDSGDERIRPLERWFEQLTDEDEDEDEQALEEAERIKERFTPSEKHEQYLEHSKLFEEPMAADRGIWILKVKVSPRRKDIAVC
jgi:hypothetical protein